MDTSKKIQVSLVIPAPPDKIFAVLSDPARHDELDAPGMVRGVEEGQPIRAIGQTFTMNMHQPELGDYRMINAVTAFVQNARIGWAPSMDPSCDVAEKLGDMDVAGHTYSFDLKPVDGSGGAVHTEVTETYEWMSVKDPKFEAMFPLVSQEQLEQSLDKLAAAVS